MSKVEAVNQSQQILEQVIEEETTQANAEQIAKYIVALMNDAGDVLRDRPYLAYSVLSGFPRQVQYHMRTKENTAARAAAYSEKLQRQADGSEISNENIERQTEWCNQLLHELNELDVIFKAIVETHDQWAAALSGYNDNGSVREFSPFFNRSKTNFKDTASSRELAEVKDQLNARLKKTERARAKK